MIFFKLQKIANFLELNNFNARNKIMYLLSRKSICAQIANELRINLKQQKKEKKNKCVK